MEGVKIRAILFDCNGVIADDEPIHLRLFRKVLEEEGIGLTTKEYFSRYLAMDDRSCFSDVLARKKRPHGPKIIQALIRRKAAYYRKAIKKELRIFPGVRAFVLKYEKRFAMAVVSGALRDEIEWILKRAGIAGSFSGIVSAETVRRGKPDPECYRKGLAALNRLPRFKRQPLRPDECAAIEDSIHGVRAAKKARMRCIAVTNSYSRKNLAHADLVIPSFTHLLRHPPAFLSP